MSLGKTLKCGQVQWECEESVREVSGKCARSAWGVCGESAGSVSGSCFEHGRELPNYA